MSPRAEQSASAFRGNAAVRKRPPKGHQRFGHERPGAGPRPLVPGAPGPASSHPLRLCNCLCWQFLPPPLVADLQVSQKSSPGLPVYPPPFLFMDSSPAAFSPGVSASPTSVFNLRRGSKRQPCPGPFPQPQNLCSHVHQTQILQLMPQRLYHLSVCTLTATGLVHALLTSHKGCFTSH